MLTRLEGLSTEWRLKTIAFFGLIWFPVTVSTIYVCLENVLQAFGIVKNQGIDEFMAIVSATFDFIMLVMMVFCLVSYLVTGAPEVASNIFNLNLMVFACGKSWHPKVTVATATPMCIFIATQIITWNFCKRVWTRAATVLLSYALLIVFLVKDIVFIDPKDVYDYWRLMSSRQQVVYMYLYNVIIGMMFCASMTYHSYVQFRVQKFVATTKKCLLTSNMEDLGNLRLGGVRWLKLEIEQLFDDISLRLLERNRWLPETFRLMVEDRLAEEDQLRDSESSVMSNEGTNSGTNSTEFRNELVLVAQILTISCEHSESGDCEKCVANVRQLVERKGRICFHDSPFHNAMYVSANVASKKIELADSIAALENLRRRSKEMKILTRVNIVCGNARVGTV